MAERFREKLHPGFPSRTPTKGSVIAAEVSPTTTNKDDACIPPHTVVFACDSQKGTIVRVKPTITPGKKGRIAGVAIAGVQSPEDAIKYPDSDGRFGIINAGQARLVAKKYKDGRIVRFEPMDQIYIKTATNNYQHPNGNAYDVLDRAVGYDCGFEYANKTEYRQPVMIDQEEYDAKSDAVKKGYEKLGTVVGCTENSDLLTVELKIA